MAATLLIATTTRPALRVAMAIYGVTLVLLFAGSATYHVGRWSVVVEKRLQRVDHGNIFLVIAGTYTPVTVALLGGWPRTTILVLVWTLAFAGLSISLLGIHVPRALLAGLYVGVGCVAVPVAPSLYSAVGGNGIALIFAAGATYTAGALCYAFKWPDPWHDVFGYHEVFHLLVIAASALFVTFMAVYVAPRH
ncbi:MAG: hemolysin III family protein [Candidatus Dormibacteria bacterium]